MTSNGVNLDELLPIVRTEMQSLAARIKQNHLDAGQKASGRTYNSIQWDTHIEANNLVGSVSGRKPFGTLETGRKPGKIPSGFQQIIREWMSHKGIHGIPMPYVRPGFQGKYTPQERGDMSLAGAIAHTIATKGTYLYRKGVDYNTGEKPDIYSSAIDETMERLSSLLEDFGQQIDKYIHKDYLHIKLNN